MAKKITNGLISLPQDVSIDRVVDHPHSLEIFIFSPETERLCPVCDSRYICITGHHPVSDFLDAYHMDRQLRAATRGMTLKEREMYHKRRRSPVLLICRQIRENELCLMKGEP